MRKSEILAMALCAVLTGCGLQIGNGNGNGNGNREDREASKTMIWPLQTGNAWTFKVTGLGNFPVCQSRNYTQRVVNKTSVGGQTAYEVTSICDNEPDSQYSVSGDLVQIYYASSWVPALATPLQNGYRWASGGKIFTWYQVGAMSVAAGQFSDCWRREQAQWFSAYSIFCRGAGIVEDHLEDDGHNGWHAVLVSKNF